MCRNPFLCRDEFPPTIHYPGGPYLVSYSCLCTMQGWLAMVLPLLSSFPFQPWLSLYCPHSHISHAVPFTVLVPISVDNGQLARLQLISCKIGYLLLWEELLFEVSITTVTSVLILNILPCKIKWETSN